MRGLIPALALAVLLSFAAALTGCGGAQDEVLEYDPEVSKQKSAEYEKQMMEGMKKAGRMPRGQR